MARGKKGHKVGKKSRAKLKMVKGAHHSFGKKGGKKRGRRKKA